MVCSLHEGITKRFVGTFTFWSMVIVLVGVFTTALGYVAYASASKDQVNGLAIRVEDTRDDVKAYFKRVDDSIKTLTAAVLEKAR